VLYIVPSRGRPHNVLELIDAWEATRAVARLQIIVDEDDPELPAYKDVMRVRSGNWFSLTIAPPLGGLGPILNAYAVPAAAEEDIIGFMGDDHRPHTSMWDVQLASAAYMGLAYGNDGIQGPLLPTAVAIDARIIRAIGYMVPPGMTHLYVDNVWKEWGGALNGTARYLPHVSIEHVHPVKYPERADERYAFVNSAEMYDHDKRALDSYMSTKFWSDIHKMKNAFGEGTML